MKTQLKKVTDVTVSENPDGVSHFDTLKKIRFVMRAVQRHSAWVEKQCGVTGSQLWLMEKLRESGGLRIGDIASKMAVHQTTISNLVDALAKQGYVTKTRNRSDHRIVIIALTEEGNKILLNAPKPARGVLQEALQRLDIKDLTQLDRGLQALMGALEPDAEMHESRPFPFAASE
jgi:DNA-binding MarR family transcriptional regulator